MRRYLTVRLGRLLADEGGWIQAALMGAGLLGNLFGKGAQKASESRMTEADIRQRQDLLRNQQFNTAQNAQFQQGALDLQRKGFEEHARGARAKQQALADILLNFQPTRVNVPGIQSAQVSGGLAESLSGAGRDALTELIAQARLKQLTGDSFQGGQILAPPQLSGIPKASGWEKAAGIAGILGGLAGGLGSLMQPKYTQVTGEAVNPELFGNVRF